MADITIPYLDKAGATLIVSKIKTLVNNKVDKVSGKQLSTNDYTTTEKNKLSGIASNAQVNVIESVKVNNTALTVTSKAVNITVPTKVSQITNDSEFQTKSQVSTAIANAVAGATHLEPKKVTTLPTSGQSSKYLYIVANTEGDGNNICKEYLWLDNKWEEVGSQQISLDGYAKLTDFVAITTAEIDAMFA